MRDDYSQQLNLLLTLKLRQLHANNLTGVSIEDLRRMLVNYVWRKKRPMRLSDMVNDVFSIRDEEVIRWLASESRIEGYHSSLSDFTHLFNDEE
ncbi:MAG: DNA-binding protein [Erysipelothrix sp.]|nr:DNA-binding protein [Erysipelothrix sp.]